MEKIETARLCLTLASDGEMNRRFGSAYSVEISSLQSGKTLTSATPELETHSHL